MSTLLPISEFIETARKQGAVFEGRDARVHLAYLTKLGLLPSATKRKIGDSLQGCYATSEIATLLDIQALKQRGMTYSQIAKSNQLKPLAVVDQPLSLLNPASSDFVLHVKASNVAYLVLGLVLGIIVSTLNTSGLSAMKQSPSLSLATQSELTNRRENSGVYLIAVPKQNLDKVGKTNINYLIKN